VCSRKRDAKGKLEKEIQHTHGIRPGRGLKPCMCTDANGELCLAYRAWAGGDAGTEFLRSTGEVWARGSYHGWDSRNAWHTAIAASPDGKAAMANDLY